MKIVFISSRSLSYMGGIETYMSNLCSLLAKKGYEIILYTEGTHYEKYTFNGFTIISFSSIKNKFLNKILIGWKATKHAMRYHADAKIFHYNAMAAGLSSWFPLLLNKTVIFQGHGFEWQRAKWNKNQKKIIKILDDFCLRINKNITMVSEDQSDYVRKKYNKVTVTITPGINLPKSFTNSEILSKYNLKQNFYFLSLGRIVPEKKIDVLIQAFLKIKKSDIKLVIAGDDPYSKQYILECKKLAKDNPNIIFTGAVYGVDKETLLRNSYSFCIPSELEGLPITLLEAMSYSRPCIASNIPANIEALGENGIYFETNNLEQLYSVLADSINNSELLEQKGSLNFKRVKEYFTWDKVANDYERYCSKILNSQT